MQKLRARLLEPQKVSSSKKLAVESVTNGSAYRKTLAAQMAFPSVIFLYAVRKFFQSRLYDAACLDVSSRCVISLSMRELHGRLTFLYMYSFTYRAKGLKQFL